MILSLFNIHIQMYGKCLFVAVFHNKYGDVWCGLWFVRGRYDSNHMKTFGVRGFTNT
jgi:hypothetical protein